MLADILCIVAVCAALVKDEKKLDKNAAYLGKGLDEVKAKDNKIYEALTTPVLDKDGKPTAERVPLQTFSGYDAMTGTAK